MGYDNQIIGHLMRIFIGRINYGYVVFVLDMCLLVELDLMRILTNGDGIHFADSSKTQFAGVQG